VKAKLSPEWVWKDSVVVLNVLAVPSTTAACLPNARWQSAQAGVCGSVERQLRLAVGVCVCVDA
jgi:hypothetical protein